MNTLSDILAFNREYASRHIAGSDRGWWVAGVALAALFLLATVAGWAAAQARSSVHAVSVVQDLLGDV